MIAKYSILDQDVYNFDETGFMMGVISSAMVVTSSERRSHVKMKQPGNREWVTVIQGVGATGFWVPPFIIVSGKFHLSSWYENGVLPHDWVVATSSNGWTTNERGLEWIQHFNQHTKSRTSGNYRLLVLDGHESHHSVEFEQYCKNNNIITLCMPAHSSHILQPLDVGCFGPLKKAYGKQIELKIKAGTTHITKEDFFPAFTAAFKQAITTQNIQGGFRGAGLIPHDPTAVLSKLDVVLKTPTPPGTAQGDAASWITKTPTNTIEADSQTQLITNRISLHQGSSPTSIIEAVNQLAKGTQSVMHEVSLLRSENKVLRSEMHILSRRRRAKKARLQEGGSMVVAQGQLQRSRLEVVVEIKQERLRNGGGESSAPATRRRCGVCGNVGHNARTCQIDISSSEEEDSE
jgi:hypothetical protein